MRKSVLSFIRKVAAPSGKLSRYLRLGVILLFACWIRIQMVEQIPEGQFLGNDAYLYYWQGNNELRARTMAFNQGLPANFFDFDPEVH